MPLKSSHGQEFFIWDLLPKSNDLSPKSACTVVAAIEDYIYQLVSKGTLTRWSLLQHGELSADIPTALSELSHEYKFIGLVRTITDKHYRSVCDVLINGGVAISSGFLLEREIRDRAGFCTPKLVVGQHYYRGFTDNPRRPGIVCQKTADLSFPRGNDVVTIGKSKIGLPKGSYFVDAEVFDEIMLGQSLYCID